MKYYLEINELIGKVVKNFPDSYVDKIKSLGEKGNEVQIDEIRKLITKAKTALKDNDFFTADDIYRKILSMYQQAHYDLRESAYEDLFNLWFRLYSYS